MSAHQDQNRRAWDRLVAQEQRHTRPAHDEDFANPLATINADGWLGSSIAGQRVLCLGAGGGRHSALYAAAGAIVTVVDLSPAMLALDRAVATERQLPITVVETSMEDLSMFRPGEFDLVVQPVSTCYVPEIKTVYAQIAYVLRANGLYISQHKQPGSLQTSVHTNAAGRYELIEPYYRQGALPAVENSPHREPGTLEYLHRWSELLGELCRAGFVIQDISEPCHAAADATHGSFAHRSQFVAPYVRIKACRTTSVTPRTESSASAGQLWLPE
jgi:SAM-dependent methyltransferase